MTIYDKSSEQSMICR